MKSSSRLVWIRLNFLVNDLEFPQGLMRPSEKDATDFQILIEDRFLGSFALHDDFDLQLWDPEGVRDWRKVSLEELKMVFLETSRDVGASPIARFYREFRSKVIPVISTARQKRFPAEGSRIRSWAGSEATGKSGGMRRFWWIRSSARESFSAVQDSCQAPTQSM